MRYGKNRTLKKITAYVGVLVTAAILINNASVISVMGEKAAAFSFWISFPSSTNIISENLVSEYSEIKPGNIKIGNNDTDDISDNKNDPTEADGVDFMYEKKDLNIIRQTFSPTPEGEIYIILPKGSVIRNTSKKANSKVLEMAKKTPEISLLCDGTPEVLIMHTHTTEAFQNEKRDFFTSESYISRSTDNNKNVVRIGNEIAIEIEKKGIGVIHDTTIHDYPEYSGAYDRSAETVKSILKKYPSIKVVFDVHRDAIESSNGDRIAPYAVINGKETAQIMFVCGSDENNDSHKDYAQNLALAAIFQEQCYIDNKELARPLLFNAKLYNQHLTTGSVLIEVGDNANTLDEAIRAAKFTGKSIAKALVLLKK